MIYQARMLSVWKRKSSLRNVSEETELKDILMRGTTFSPRRTVVSYTGCTDLNGDGKWSVEWRATRRETGLMTLSLLWASGPNRQMVNLKAFTDHIRITPRGETLTLENHDLEPLRTGYSELRKQLIECVREIAPEIVRWLNEMGTACFVIIDHRATAIRTLWTQGETPLEFVSRPLVSPYTFDNLMEQLVNGEQLVVACTVLVDGIPAEPTVVAVEHANTINHFEDRPDITTQYFGLAPNHGGTFHEV